MERDEEDSSDEYYESYEEEDDDSYTTFNNPSYDFDGESDGRGSKPRGLQISVPRRRSISIVLERVESSQQGASPRAQLKISMPRSLKLWSGNALSGSERLSEDDSGEHSSSLSSSITGGETGWDSSSLSGSATEGETGQDSPSASTSGVSQQELSSRVVEGLEHAEKGKKAYDQDGDGGEMAGGDCGTNAAAASTSKVQAEGEREKFAGEGAADVVDTPESSSRKGSMETQEKIAEKANEHGNISETSSVSPEKATEDESVSGTSSDSPGKKSLKFAGDGEETSPPERKKKSGKKALRFAEDSEDDTRAQSEAKQDADADDADVPSTSYGDGPRKPAAQKSLRFAEIETDEDEEEQVETAKSKRFLRFVDEVGKIRAKRSPRFADEEEEAESVKGKRSLRFADEEEEEVEKTGAMKSLRFADEKEKAEKVRAKRSLRFADDAVDNEEKAEKAKAKAKRSLRFADDDEEKVEKVKAKRSLRFADDDEEKPEKVGAKRTLRFADEGTPSKQARLAEGRKSVRFMDNDPRKWSVDEPVVAFKQVRFLVPTVDATGKESSRVFFPGVQRRKRRGTIKTTTVEVYPDPPLALVLYMMDYKRFKHMTGPWRRFTWWLLSWLIAIVSTLGFTLGMVLLCIYVHVRPQIPILNIDSLDYLDLWTYKLGEDALVEQQIEDQGNYYNYELITDTVFLVRYQNNNHHFDIYNYYVEVTILYRGVVFGKTSQSDIFVERNSQVMLSFFSYEEGRKLSLLVGYTLEEDAKQDRFDIIFELEVKGKMMPLGMLTTSKHFWVRVRCDIILTKRDIETGNCRNHNPYKY